MYFCSICVHKQILTYTHIYLARALMCLHSVFVCVCLTHTLPEFVAGSHPSFCLPHTLALCNTRLISNSFLEPLHSNYQRRVRGKVSSRDRAAHSPFLVHPGIFQIKGKPFPVGISSTTPAVASRSAARLTL